MDITMRKKTLILIGSALAILASGIGFYLWRFKTVETASLRRGPLIESVYGLGVVVAPHTYQLKIAVGSMIRVLHVQEGDQVKKGDPLLTFDEGGTRIAPFSGTITEVPFHEGEIVAPNVALLTLVDLEERDLEVSFEQRAVLRVRKGQKVIATFESLQAQKLEGSVDSLFPRESQFIARIRLREYPAGVLPAMTADISIEVGRRDDVLQVPLAAVASGHVVRVRDGHRQKIEAQLGVTDGEWVEVVKGDLRLEDQVIVRRR